MSRSVLIFFGVTWCYLLYRSAYLAATPLEQYKKGAVEYSQSVREDSVTGGRSHHFGRGLPHGK